MIGQKFRTLTMLTILLTTTTSIPTLAEAPLAAEPQGDPKSAAKASIRSNVMQAPDITTLLNRIAKISAFTNWQTAAAQPVRALHNPEGQQNALLWSVQTDGQPAGYLVTSPDGKHLYEFSTREVPALPPAMQGKELTEGYIYAGPMLHLVYYHTDGSTLDLYNLQTGETLPWGELKHRVPSPGVAGVTPQQTTEQAVALSPSAESDALYATGLFGQHRLDAGKQKGVHPLRSYAAGDTFTEPSYIVYDAVPDKLYVTLQVTKVVTQGSVRFLEVADPFLPGASVYIDSRFPVNVFLTASSAT